MICLGNYKDAGSKLLGMLDVLLSAEIDAEEKKRILEGKFQIKMSRTMKKEVEQMCNYSKGVYESGLKKGRSQGRSQGLREAREADIRNLINNMGLSIEHVMEALKIPESQREGYRKAIENR